MKLYSVEKRETEASVKEFLAHCVDILKFLDFCKVCPSYDTRWSCPPFSFDPLSVWEKYQTIQLHAWILTPEGDCTTEQLLYGLGEQKHKTVGELMALEAQHPGSWALVCGTCNLCETCQRSQGKPCIRPDELRYSIEALGGDVGETMNRYFDKPILWIEAGKCPDYLMLVGGLLLPE